MFSQLFLFSLHILPPPSFASFYFAFFLYFLFRIFPLVIITNSPSCCSYHEIYISTLPSLTLNNKPSRYGIAERHGQTRLRELTEKGVSRKSTRATHDLISNQRTQ